MVHLLGIPKNMNNKQSSAVCCKEINTNVVCYHLHSWMDLGLSAIKWLLSNLLLLRASFVLFGGICLSLSLVELGRSSAANFSTPNYILQTELQTRRQTQIFQRWVNPASRELRLTARRLVILWFAALSKSWPLIFLVAVVIFGSTIRKVSIQLNLNNLSRPIIRPSLLNIHWFYWVGDDLINWIRPDLSASSIEYVIWIPKEEQEQESSLLCRWLCYLLLPANSTMSNAHIPSVFRKNSFDDSVSLIQTRHSFDDQLLLSPSGGALASSSTSSTSTEESSTSHKNGIYNNMLYTSRRRTLSDASKKALIMWKNGGSNKDRDSLREERRTTLSPSDDQQLRPSPMPAALSSRATNGATPTKELLSVHEGHFV